VASVDLAQQASYVFIEVLKRVLYCSLLIIGCAVGSYRSTREQWLDDRPAPLLLYGLIVAIAIFFVHNLIDFSMFEIGPMFVFAMLVGAALGVRSQRRAGRRGRIVPILATVAWLGCAVAFVAPLLVAEGLAHDADDALRADDPAAAARDYARAAEALPIPNSDYWRRAARAWVYAGSRTEARRTIDAALAADALDLSALRLRAAIALQSTPPDGQRAIADFQRLLELNPNDVQARLEFAGTLERFGQPRRARDEYRAALRANDQLSPDEPKRLARAERERIEREIERLESR
jgi:tetratricopeptide (TPR) repeat protein